MIDFKQLTKEDILEKEVITKESFPEVISLDAEDFIKNKKYINKYIWYGLFDNDDITCVCSVSKTNDKDLVLELLETKPEYQNEGYGAEMMNHIIDIYGSKYNISVMAMYKDLDKFYQKWSFKEIKREPMLEMVRKKS